MKKYIIAGALFLLLIITTNYSYPLDVFKEMGQISAKDEEKKMNEGLVNLIDPQLCEEFSHRYLTDQDVKLLYQEFLNIIVEPPNPDTYTIYEIENAEESLYKTKTLVIKINSMIRAMPMEVLEKYGYLLQAMRDVAYYDFIHIPYAMRNDNSRDYYWWGIHHKSLREAKDLYSKIME
ncbi:MAG: hypothetical protein PHQ52_01885 [Candidatus Omnitrophica bacterium]|nr:hypothetical protein [Candidatus Omnitrophota bacterium]